ncbi:DUF134 domain-containing protein [Clostridium sp.]|uniref:DUF134 domain-containing protein n=1 Tax=Clostridium sp. TaxID=1506 RepID=UPI003F3C7927
MARPRKFRKVCCLPKSTLFGPIKKINLSEKYIIMTIDEYEVIRLMDLEGLTQEECSKRMNVARTTIQRIYNDARLKIAKTLVDGYILKIEGGDFTLCNNEDNWCGCNKCHKIKK